MTTRALVLLALVLWAGCSDAPKESEVPADAVARVGATVITKERVRAFAPATVQQPRASRQATRYLILAEWVEREAKRQGIAVRASTISNALSTDDAKRPSAIARVETPLLVSKLIKTATADPVTRADVARYYRSHPREYASREARYMRLVGTESRNWAAAAKRALYRGQSWKTVIARSSTDGESPPIPSGNMGAYPGEMPEPLGTALYAARRGAIAGPVRVDRWWYLFVVTAIDRVPGQSLAQARTALRARLEARRAEREADLFDRRLRARYRPMTICPQRRPLPECRN